MKTLSTGCESPNFTVSLRTVVNTSEIFPFVSLSEEAERLKESWVHEKVADHINLGSRLNLAQSQSKQLTLSVNGLIQFDYWLLAFDPISANLGQLAININIH